MVDRVINLYPSHIRMVTSDDTALERQICTALAFSESLIHVSVHNTSPKMSDIATSDQAFWYDSVGHHGYKWDPKNTRWVDMGAVGSTYISSRWRIKDLNDDYIKRAYTFKMYKLWTRYYYDEHRAFGVLETKLIYAQEYNGYSTYHVGDCVIHDSGEGVQLWKANKEIVHEEWDASDWNLYLPQVPGTLVAYNSTGIKLLMYNPASHTLDGFPLSPLSRRYIEMEDNTTHNTCWLPKHTDYIDTCQASMCISYSGEFPFQTSKEYNVKLIGFWDIDEINAITNPTIKGSYSYVLELFLQSYRVRKNTQKLSDWDPDGRIYLDKWIIDEYYKQYVYTGEGMGILEERYPVFKNQSGKDTRDWFNGYGVLNGVTSCIVKESLNGEFTVDIEYLQNAKQPVVIEKNMLISLKPSQDQNRQLFRIVGLKNDISGKVTLTATHISYDTVGYFICKIPEYDLEKSFLEKYDPEKVYPAGSYVRNSDNEAQIPDGAYCNDAGQALPSTVLKYNLRQRKKKTASGWVEDTSDEYYPLFNPDASYDHGDMVSYDLGGHGLKNWFYCHHGEYRGGSGDITDENWNEYFFEIPKKRLWSNDFQAAAVSVSGQYTGKGVREEFNGTKSSTYPAMFAQIKDTIVSVRMSDCPVLHYAIRDKLIWFVGIKPQQPISVLKRSDNAIIVSISTNNGSSFKQVTTNLPAFSIPYKLFAYNDRFYLLIGTMIEQPLTPDLDPTIYVRSYIAHLELYSSSDGVSWVLINRHRMTARSGIRPTLGFDTMPVPGDPNVISLPAIDIKHSMPIVSNVSYSEWGAFVNVTFNSHLPIDTLPQFDGYRKHANYNFFNYMVRVLPDGDAVQISSNTADYDASYEDSLPNNPFYVNESHLTILGDWNDDSHIDYRIYFIGHLTRAVGVGEPESLYYRPQTSETEVGEFCSDLNWSTGYAYYNNKICSRENAGLYLTGQKPEPEDTNKQTRCVMRYNGTFHEGDAETIRLTPVYYNDHESHYEVGIVALDDDALLLNHTYEELTSDTTLVNIRNSFLVVYRDTNANETKAFFIWQGGTYDGVMRDWPFLPKSYVGYGSIGSDHKIVVSAENAQEIYLITNWAEASGNLPETDSHLAKLGKVRLSSTVHADHQLEAHLSIYTRWPHMSLTDWKKVPPPLTHLSQAIQVPGVSSQIEFMNDYVTPYVLTSDGEDPVYRSNLVYSISYDPGNTPDTDPTCTPGAFKLDYPENIRAVLAQKILPIFRRKNDSAPVLRNGEIDVDAQPKRPFEVKFDNNKIIILGAGRGVARDKIIQYGNELEAFTIEEDISTCYRAVYPYYYTEEEGFVDLTTVGCDYRIVVPEKIRDVKGYKAARDSVYLLDLTTLTNDAGESMFESAPVAEDEILTAVSKFDADNGILEPKVSFTIKMTQLRNNANSATYDFLEYVGLGDTMWADIAQYNYREEVRIVSLEYDVLTGLYKTITFGKASDRIENILVGINQDVKNGNKRAATQYSSTSFVNKKVTESLSSDAVSNAVIKGLVQSDTIDGSLGTMLLGSNGITCSLNDVIQLVLNRRNS